MKVLISGAGIAGNALAFWLSKLGHDVTVVERFPSIRATGLQIDLRGAGIEVLKRMGLEQAFRSKSAPEQGLRLIDSSGKQRAFFPANTSRKGPQSFTSEYEIMRGDLCHLLHDATNDRVTYIFGTSIESFTEKDGAVEVRFGSGETGRFDLVVGADGQGSRTRKLMLGPSVADGFYPCGSQYVGYFTIPQPMQEGEGYMATSYIAPGKRGIMTRRQNPHELQIYLGCTANSERLKNARGDVGAEKAALTEIFQGAGWKTDEILESLKDADNFYCERIGLVKLDSWSRGRVTLVGDAGYCPSANTGMGTTAAIVGAYILAGEIGNHCGPNNGKAVKKAGTEDGLAAALGAYERKFRPFMTQVQDKVSDGSIWDKMPSSAFGIAIMNYIVGVIAFLRLNVFGEWLLAENVKGWDLPDYDEMVRA